MLFYVWISTDGQSLFTVSIHAIYTRVLVMSRLIIFSRDWPSWYSSNYFLTFQTKINIWYTGDLYCDLIFSAGRCKWEDLFGSLHSPLGFTAFSLFRIHYNKKSQEKLHGLKTSKWPILPLSKFNRVLVLTFFMHCLLE